MKKKLRKQFQKEYPWWDHFHMFKMLQDWLEHSSKMHKERGCLVRSDVTAKQMKIAAALIKRINEDEYSSPNKVFGCRNRHIQGDFCGLGAEGFSYNPKEQELRKQDVEYLFDFMKKHVLTWWD